MHKLELPIARNTQIYANSQRTKPPYAAITDFCLFTPPDSNRISAEVCDCFGELLEEGQLPSWVISLAPIEELEKGKRGGKVIKPRMFMSRGIALIMPQLIDNSVLVGMLLVDLDIIKPISVVNVFDVDGGKGLTVMMPKELNVVETEVYLEVLGK